MSDDIANLLLDSKLNRPVKYIGSSKRNVQSAAFATFVMLCMQSLPFVQKAGTWRVVRSAWFHSACLHITVTLHHKTSQTKPQCRHSHGVHNSDAIQHC